MVTPSLVQTVGPTGVVVLYLFYEFHYGRVAKFQQTLAAFSGAIVALSRHVDGVDESAVVNSMPGDVIRPERLYSANADDAANDELVDELATLIHEELQQTDDTEENQ
jgi:hypothetical protein